MLFVSCFSGLMMVVVVVWCIVAASLSHRVLAREFTWQQSAAFKGQVPLDLDMTSAVPAKSAVACAASCLWDHWCNTFFYNDVIGGCLRHRMVYVAPGAVTSAPGWRYFKLKTDGPDYFSDRVSSSRYRLDYATYGSWGEARNRCLEYGEDLVVLEPVVKAQFIHDFFRANSGLKLDSDIFIGAQRPNDTVPFPPSGADFRWVNGQPVNLTATERFWKHGRPPRYFKEGKGVMKLDRAYNFTWTVAYSGNYSRFPLCEKPFSLPLRPAGGLD